MIAFKIHICYFLPALGDSLKLKTPTSIRYYVSIDKIKACRNKAQNQCMGGPRIARHPPSLPLSSSEKYQHPAEVCTYPVIFKNKGQSGPACAFEPIS
ncbi:MAG: hypothetical protein Q8P24_14440 [Desulfobacterales bacterium]|nr:hypothetical protein [Desulfobacterales bacterium]